MQVFGTPPRAAPIVAWLVCGGCLLGGTAVADTGAVEHQRQRLSTGHYQFNTLFRLLGKPN